MAELSKIRKNGVDYDLKDTAAREAANKAVKTVNGAAPDKNGNVEITIPDSGGNVDLTGVVKSVNGQTPDQNGNVEIDASRPTDEQVQTAVSAYLEEHPVSGGIGSTASALLIGILKNAVYTADQSANITALEVELALGGGSGSGGGEASAYTVVCTLGDATIDNNASAVAAGASYTATITPNQGYELDIVTVLMGGADVTADVYADGVINIESVTGNVIIKVTTVEASDVLYKLAAPVTFTGDSAEQINTNVKITDEDKDFTICVVVDCDKQSTLVPVFYEAVAGQGHNDFGCTLNVAYGYANMLSIRFNGETTSYRNDDWRVESAGRSILICTHTAGSDFISKDAVAEIRPIRLSSFMVWLLYRPRP